HYQRVKVAELLGIVGRRDIWVLELGRRLYLAVEASERVGMIEEALRDDLDSARVVHHAVLRQVDHAHAALSEFTEDPVARVIGKLAWNHVIPGLRGRCSLREAQAERRH